MSGIMGGMGIIGSLIFLFLIIVIPISIYSAQKWAYKCYRELQKTNRILESIAAQRGILNTSQKQYEPGVEIIEK